MLEVKNLSKIYQHPDGSSFQAIKDVSFNVKKGEIVCIVGPSGSGKSTILECLAGLSRDCQGSVRINGQASADYLKQNRIALVSQNYSNFPWLSVFENVATGFYGQGLTELAIEKSTNTLLKRVGLYKAKGQFISKLSGGMQQRVAIVRAIAQRTDVIVFDEPFGALDIQTRSQMQEFLARLWEEEQRTMVLVTHDIDEAIYLANRIFVLGTNPGTIKEIVDVPLVRPRKPEVRFQKEFVDLKKYITYIIRSESIKAQLEEGEMVESDLLKMGLYIWPGNTPLYYAKDSGLFIKHGLNVEQIAFDDNVRKVELWRENKLDVINVTLDKALELCSTVPDLRIIEVLNRSVGADALIVRDDINTIQELQGKTIGLERSSAAEFFLFHLLDLEGMSSKDVKIKDMKCSEIGAAIISGKIDGGVLWEPWLNKALTFSDMKLLESAADYPVLYDVLIARNKTLQQKKVELEKISMVWKEAVEKLDGPDSEVISVASSHIGIPERELAGFLEKIEFFSSVPKNITDVVKKVKKTLANEKIITMRLDPKSLFVSLEK